MWKSIGIGVAIVGIAAFGWWQSNTRSLNFWSKDGRTGIHKAPFFGEVTQIQVETEVQTYGGARLMAEYPQGWSAAASTLWQELPGRLEGAYFSPAQDGGGHLAALSSASVTSITKASVARERAAGRTEDSTEEIAVEGTRVHKLSFSRPGAREDKATYYIYEGTPIRVLVAQGPGELALDEGAKLILRTLRVR